MNKVDNCIPSCALVSGYFFRRGDLLQSSPSWWWLPGKREAWRYFRQRRIALNREVEEGFVEPSCCFAEMRFYLLDGDRVSLSMAIAMTDRAKTLHGLIMGVGLKAGEDVLRRLAYSPA